MSEPRYSEAAFETIIETHLLANGYVSVAAGGFDRDRAIFRDVVLAFIRNTQPVEWARLEALHADRTGEQVLADLCKWMDTNGSLATLRHGFKCYGRTLYPAFFKAAHELNPELEARYAANRLGITRQLRYSPRSEKSLDVTLSLNGIYRSLRLNSRIRLRGRRSRTRCASFAGIVIPESRSSNSNGVRSFISQSTPSAFA